MLGAVSREEPCTAIVPRELSGQPCLAQYDFVIAIQSLSAAFEFVDSWPKPIQKMACLTCMVSVLAWDKIALDWWHPFAWPLVYWQVPFADAAVARRTIFVQHFVQLQFKISFVHYSLNVNAPHPKG